MPLAMFFLFHACEKKSSIIFLFIVELILTFLMNIFGYLIGREDLCPKDILVNYESTVSPPYLRRPIHAIFLSQPFENNFISRGTHFSL